MLMFYFNFFSIPFFSPDITVKYGFTDYGLPFKLKYLIDSTKADGTPLISKRFKEYKYSGDCCKIEIINDSDKDIVINEFRVAGAYEVSDVFVDTDSHALHDDLCCLWKYIVDEDKGTIFNHFTRLPARSMIRYVIYGRFVEPPFKEFIDLKSSSKSIRIEKTGIVNGFWYFISEYSFVPTIILILIFVGMGINRISNKNE